MKALMEMALDAACDKEPQRNASVFVEELYDVLDEGGDFVAVLALVEAVQNYKEGAMTKGCSKPAPLDLVDGSEDEVLKLSG